MRDNADPSEDAWPALAIETDALVTQELPVALLHSDDERMLEGLPDVRLRKDAVPARLRPQRFFDIVVRDP